MLSGGREAVVVSRTGLQGTDVENNRFSMLLSCVCVCFCEILSASPSILHQRKNTKIFTSKLDLANVSFFVHFLMALASGTIIIPNNKLPSGALICEQKSILMLL